MFESKTYHEKRAALNEILLQQVLNEVLRMSDEKGRERLMGSFNDYARAQQGLRDREAERVLGPVNRDEGMRYADLPTIRDYLEANLGRTYFGFRDHTSAPDGAIGTAGFATKFNDWVTGLPDLDKSFGREMKTGFYQDTSTRFGMRFPILVLVDGSLITVVIFNQHYSAQTLNLDHVPEDYRWDNHTHYALRGEMYTYRDHLTVEQFEALFTEALAAHTEVAMIAPEVKALEPQEDATPTPAE